MLRRGQVTRPQTALVGRELASPRERFDDMPDRNRRSEVPVRLRVPALWKACLGAVVALVAMTAASPALAQPPSWWADRTHAGPPNWVPQVDAPPPLDVAKARWFEREIIANEAEKVVLDEELHREFGHAAITAVVVYIAKKIALHVVFPECAAAEDVAEIVEAIHRAQTATEGLSLADKYSRLRQDTQYLEWLDRWYSRYNPRYKNTWDASSRWVHNRNSPFNRFNRRWPSLLRKLRSAGGLRDAVTAGAGCQPTPPPAPPPPSCPPPDHGGIDLLLKGEFFGQEWAAGEVTARPGDGSQTETASVGYDSESVGHFGPWRCGTSTKLTATPARGNHFDRWQSDEGLCPTASITCTVPITTTAHQITAYFAPTVYQLSVTNDQPDGIVTSGGGGGYVHPGIDCGSQPNGSSVVQVYTSCAAGAIAQRSDSDVTQLFVTADNPGPGGDAYGVASIDGCDRSVATTYPIPGGGTYVPSVQCFIDMNNDRAITVNYKDTGKSF